MDGIILWKVSGGSSLWRGLWLSSFGHSGIFYKRSAGGNDIFGGGIGTSLAASKGEERAGGDELAPFANPYLSAVFDRGCQRRGLFCRDVPYREKRQTGGCSRLYWARTVSFGRGFWLYPVLSTETERKEAAAYIQETKKEGGPMGLTFRFAAEPMEDWTVYRLAGDTLQSLAERTLKFT